MRKRNTITIAIVVVIIVILVIAFLLLTRTSPTSEPVEVTKCSIDPTTVAVGQLAIITCETQSTDKNSTHEITVKFSIQPTELITFIMGSPSTLTNPSPYVWQYTYSLNPLGTYSQPTTVNASLQSGYSNANYEIQVTFYRDNTQFANRTLDLTVND